VVCSALAGVTSAIESAVDRARTGDPRDPVDDLRAVHQRLTVDLSLPAGAMAAIDAEIEELRALLTGVRLTGEAPPRLRARILAVGERASTRLGVAALASLGIEAKWLDARDLLQSTRVRGENDHSRYLDALVTPSPDPDRLDAAADGADVILTQGFIARTPDGETCLLGRGGSDTSAALLAAMAQADQLEIWTDVHGLFTADPRLVPSARLIRSIGYREARELAAMGAKVLHPRCLDPVLGAGIPLTVRNVFDPGAPGTRVEADAATHPAVTAVTCRTGVTLISITSVAMWHTSGYLARVFEPFDELGISVDLVATSQTTVSVTLDRPGDGPTGGDAFDRLVERLEGIGTVRVQHPVAVVSIVGRRIRAVLHELGPALAVFRDRPVHMVSDSVDDLNLSFVTDEPDARTLVVRLHEHLFGTEEQAARFGPSWEELRAGGTAPGVPSVATSSGAPAWWRSHRDTLLSAVADGQARYVYHLASVHDAARRVRDRLPSVRAVHYAMKANAHPEVLRAVVAEGCGIECVSAGEIRFARETVGDAVPLLFTPNFCPVDEFRVAFEAGATVVVDGPEILSHHRDLFAGREVGVRVDPGIGRGHHEKVRTAGAHAKFGHPLEELGGFIDAARDAGARVVGLHAHVGSGVTDARAWAATASQLAAMRERLPDLRWIDVGGGLGVPERPGQSPLDLDLVEAGLRSVRAGLGDVDLWLEPGRYLVSEAGVLVAPVTQVRRKGSLTFVGLATGMNSLIRPALYGAWHAIVNLTRLDDPPSGRWQVVGPICESSDVFGRDRLLPETRPGDVLLIATAGAYGATMASRYNLRAPAEEVVIPG
jgi:diaminopimelate decarboxylase/aspartate kinase